MKNIHALFNPKQHYYTRKLAIVKIFLTLLAKTFCRFCETFKKIDIFDYFQNHNSLCMQKTGLPILG